MKRGAAGFGLLVVTLMCLLLLEPLPVHAAATLVQQNNNGGSFGGGPATATITVTLNTVTSGDVIVVGFFFDHNFGVTLNSISDSLSSSFAQAVTAPGAILTAQIYTATLASGCAGSGCYTLTTQFHIPSGGNTPLDVFVYEVAGVTTAGLATGTGASTGSSVSTSSVSFTTGAFLFGMIAYSTGPTVTHGAGFTLSPENSGQQASNGQFMIAGASSSSIFPATLSAGTTWVEASVALNPTSTSSTSTTTTGPPIPEYPLGLPILAILTILAYGLIRRRTRN